MNRSNLIPRAQHLLEMDALCVCVCVCTRALSSRHNINTDAFVAHIYSSMHTFVWFHVQPAATCVHLSRVVYQPHTLTLTHMECQWTLQPKDEWTLCTVQKPLNIKWRLNETLTAKKCIQFPVSPPIFSNESGRLGVLSSILMNKMALEENWIQSVSPFPQ